VFEPASANGVVFHAATGVDATAIARVRESVRQRLLRVFVCRGLLRGDAAQAMAQWEHGGGFSVDASVRIAAADRAGRERLLRYCARPPFALDRLRELDAEHPLYERAKPSPGGTGRLRLTPLELLDRLAALVPQPRLHHHHNFGARGCDLLLEISATTLTVWTWPNPGIARRQPNGRTLLLTFKHGPPTGSSCRSATIKLGRRRRPWPGPRKIHRCECSFSGGQRRPPRATVRPMPSMTGGARFGLSQYVGHARPE
jgi:hypothetical protein